MMNGGECDEDYMYSFVSLLECPWVGFLFRTIDTRYCDILIRKRGLLFSLLLMIWGETLYV